MKKALDILLLYIMFITMVIVANLITFLIIVRWLGYE